MAQHIEHEIRRKPLQNLTRLPLHPNPIELYDALDLCLMTSSFEGLPVFLLDGLARGIPCVATAVGDIPLLLKDGGGVIVEVPGDIDSLEQGIRSLVDPVYRQREGTIGRARVRRRFNLERFVSEYESVIFPRQ
jgi:glycosyltransferase involved in cell wall biosynthesis